MTQAVIQIGDCAAGAIISAGALTFLMLVQIISMTNHKYQIIKIQDSVLSKGLVAEEVLDA